MQKKMLHTVGRASVVIIVILVVFFFFRYMFHIIYPIAISSLLASFIHPWITFAYDRFHIPRIVSTCVILLCTIGLISWVLVFVITELFQGTTYLADKIPTYIQFFSVYIENVIHLYILPMYEKIAVLFSSLPSTHQENMSRNIYGLLNEMTDILVIFIQYILKSAPTVLSVFPQSIAMIGFIIVATFLLAIDYDTYVRQVHWILPKYIIEHALHAGSYIKQTFLGYMKAQMKIVLLTCLLLFIGLTTIGVQHAFTIVAFVAFVDFLPYIGTGVIFIPWIIYMFFTQQYDFTIQLSIIYGIVVIVRQIIEPKMISAHLNLRPITTLFALFIGFQLWGLIGMLLAPMTLIVLSGIYQAGSFHLIWKYITGS